MRVVEGALTGVLLVASDGVWDFLEVADLRKLLPSTPAACRRLDAGALDQSHWQGARGIGRGLRSHASLHNAGVDAALSGRWMEAERLFSAAILDNPQEALSWVARGLSRGEQGKNDLAGRDLAHAGLLFEQQGDPIKADQLKQASTRVHEPAAADEPTGNGLGSAVLGSALSTIQALAPIALKALMPMIP